MLNAPRCEHHVMGNTGMRQCKAAAKQGFNLCFQHGWAPRYYIAFQWQEHLGDHWTQRTKGVWPILFKTYEAAWDHLMDTPHFKNLHPRRKLTCCVERTKKRFPVPHLKEIA